jgi:hypothetical protein
VYIRKFCSVSIELHPRSFKTKDFKFLIELFIIYAKRFSAVSFRMSKKKKTKLHGLSPQANYTDRATTAVGEVVPTLRLEGVAWSAQRIPTAIRYLELEEYRRENRS